MLKLHQFFRRNMEGRLQNPLYSELVSVSRKKFNHDMKAEKREVLLLLDNCSGHKLDYSKYANVTVEFIAPNMKGTRNSDANM